MPEGVPRGASTHFISGGLIPPGKTAPLSVDSQSVPEIRLTAEPWKNAARFISIPAKNPDQNQTMAGDEGCKSKILWRHFALAPTDFWLVWFAGNDVPIFSSLAVLNRSRLNPSRLLAVREIRELIMENPTGHLMEKSANGPRSSFGKKVFQSM